MNIDYSKILIVNCLFGKSSTQKINTAPSNCVSYFFTNNINLKNQIITKGWNFFFINKPINVDYLESSLQSKYIKFLIFIKEYPEFKKYKHIIYFDHKLAFSNSKIENFIKYIYNNIEKSLIIPLHKRRNKNNIEGEISIANMQERYARNMSKTIDFVDKNNKNCLLCLTNLLIYINHNQIIKLLEDVYNNCMQDQQPECQIYFSILCEKYDEHVLKVKYNALCDNNNYIK